DDLDFRLPGEHRAERPRLDRSQPRARLNAGAGRHGSDEAQLVRAVIYHVAKASDRVIVFALERRQEAEGQKTVGDRTAERTFFLAALDVDMNPLTVAGDLGELIDFLLRYLNRLAPRTEFLADFRGERRNVVKLDRLHIFSSVFRLATACLINSVSNCNWNRESAPAGFQLEWLVLKPQMAGFRGIPF